MDAFKGPSNRPDIDGLRALAVLPVVIYHAGVAPFSGGYVGVDIFFVISGYLITRIIAREVDEKRFSILHFYERRARRILPALFTIVAAVLAMAIALYMPSDFADVPKSALAALLFVANLWFLTQTGYFQPRAESMPLLHTWSLGVEEQFYIFFPLFLLGIAMLIPRLRIALVWLGCLVSFAICLWSARLATPFDFFMLPARAWELLAGALLALGAFPTVTSKSGREALCWAGMGAILVAIFMFNDETPFPGYAALAPVLGATTLIAFAPGTSVGRILSWGPARWIGLISYSLYLWHWPLIVFVEYRQDAPLSAIQAMAVVGTAVAVSWASLRWIERPFRDPQTMPARRIWVTSAAGMGVLAGVSLGLMSLGGWNSRFPPKVARMAAAVQDVSPVRKICLRTNFSAPRPECTLGADVLADAMIWGDSHAVEFAWMLGQQAKREGRAIEQRTLGSCAPILDLTDQKNPDCSRFNKAVFAEIANRPEIQTVYFASYWAGRADANPGLAGDLLEKTLDRVLAEGQKVIVIGPVPSQPFFVPYKLQRMAAYDIALPKGRTVTDYRKEAYWITRRYRDWESKGIEVIDPAPALRNGDAMEIIHDGSPLYFDKHHLTLAGARLVLETAGAIDKGKTIGANRNNR